MSKVEEFKTEVNVHLMHIYMAIGMDRPSNHDEILDFVAEDVMETADPDEWHSGDVAIAFRRWVEHQSETDIDKDDDGTCLYCGQKCWHGEMCDEQQAGGFTSTEPDKQRLVDALIDVLAEDMEKGDTTVLDGLLLRMPYDILKYALPEDMWADFEDSREDLINKIMRERYGDDDPKYDGKNRAFLESLSDDELECMDSGQHLKSCDDDGFCNNCGFQDDFINDEELLGE